MPKFTHWYLVELDGLLRGNVSAERLHELLSEIECHLQDAVQERTAKGMSIEEAELAALEAIGSPEKIAAEELARNASGRKLKFGKQLVYGGAAVMAGSMLFAALLTDAQFHPLFGFGLFWGGLALLIGSGLLKQVNWRIFGGLMVVASVSLAFHQGTRHVYVGDTEWDLDKAQTAIRVHASMSELAGANLRTLESVKASFDNRPISSAQFMTVPTGLGPVSSLSAEDLAAAKLSSAPKIELITQKLPVKLIEKDLNSIVNRLRPQLLDAASTHRSEGARLQALLDTPSMVRVLQRVIPMAIVGSGLIAIVGVLCEMVARALRPRRRHWLKAKLA